jgi:putative lipoprotein
MCSVTFRRSAMAIALATAAGLTLSVRSSFAQQSSPDQTAPAAPASSSVKGTATYGKSPALPPDAVLIVQLRDLNRDADDSAAVLAEQRIAMAGRKSPVSFAVNFDAAKIPAKVPFGVSASITGHGKLLFVLVRPVTIPDISGAAPVQLALSRATSNKGKMPPSPEAPPHL